MNKCEQPRCAVYGRYSFDAHPAQDIEEQVRFCMDNASQHGRNVAAEDARKNFRPEEK